jgi:hypothetical protein
MPIDAETTDVVSGSNTASGYASEVTLSRTTNGPFGASDIDLAIHTMLNRFQPNSTKPASAAVGISAYSYFDSGGVFRRVVNGDSSAWPVALYRSRCTSFTISIGFYRCAMTGSSTVQHWG